MILNPSHEITLKGLPSEILDAYVRYKKGSRAIVTWLVRFGSQKYKGSKTLPIKELASLARSVAHSIKELPEVIHFHFRETIAARKRLSQFFRKAIDSAGDDDDTANHEHFTASLTDIYADLCKRCHSHQRPNQTSNHVECSSLLAEPIKNHYACLPVEDCEEGLSTENVTGFECDDCQHDQPYSCPGPQESLEIENDEMSTAIETASTLEQIDEILKTVRRFWQQAGRGQTHFVSATGVTNSAWAILRELEHKLKGEEEVMSTTILHQRCCLFRHAAGDPNSPLANVHALLDSLVEAERAIGHYLNCHKLTAIADCPSCVQKPWDYIQQTDVLSGNPATSFSIAIMDNILHLMCGERPAVVILQSSPIFADIGYLLSHQNDRSTSFRCILGLHIFSLAYKAYLSALPRPSTISTCRIIGLKLAKEASSTIGIVLENKDSFPCRCPETIAFHLANLKDAVDSYARHKCWDIYFQSPWVAGNHAIEMLDMLSYYGMRLLHYRHYVAAVLHSYNALVHFASIEPIPVLEHVCETFTSVFFPAGRPTSHFKNCWARYVGARLRFKKGHKRHGNEKDSWCMAVPAHAAKNAAGLGFEMDRKKCMAMEPKFDYGRIDPMFRLKQLDWHIDFSQEKQPQRRESSTPVSPLSWSTPSVKADGFSTLEKFGPNLPPTNTVLQDDQSKTHPLLAHLSMLDASVAGSRDQILDTTSHMSPIHEDKHNTIPTTRFNHLAFFHTTTQLIKTITAKTHSSEHNKTTTPNNSNNNNLCICFVHTLLAGADRIVEGRRFGGVACWTKTEREEAVEVVTSVLKEGLLVENEMKTGEKWLWSL